MKTRLAITVIFAIAMPVIGCTVCDSELGIAVRSGIFNDTLPTTLLKVLLPFPLVVLAIHFITRHLPD
jgi:hypothetical protein